MNNQFMKANKFHRHLEKINYIAKNEYKARDKNDWY